ncbi:hypothetical protein K6Y31_03270 [Motilimonas cestriensis]|uniref:CopL family metal-binding regulatory protein n=1 Tax=Motilimonas cestriensis TaxID=2742685 RepID=A0ABS8W5N6_9GAMM|nr:hypothetical protein [Motilimonas cestriensis]MCE2593830.1 hypothetical protein [Motilimonas cestriensis]
MQLSSIHKIWICLLTLTALVMSSSASSSAMMNMQMASLTSNATILRTSATDMDMASEQKHQAQMPHCNEQQMPSHQTLPTEANGSDHCNKMAANDCCPAVCISLAVPLTPSEQIIVRQPHRTLVALESAGQVIARASSLYRPPIS